LSLKFISLINAAVRFVENKNYGFTTYSNLTHCSNKQKKEKNQKYFDGSVPTVPEKGHGSLNAALWSPSYATEVTGLLHSFCLHAGSRINSSILRKSRSRRAVA